LRAGESPKRLQLLTEEFSKGASVEKRTELASKSTEQYFELIRPELTDEYYNWFIALDPDSEAKYLIDPKLLGYWSKKNQGTVPAIKVLLSMLTTFRPQ
jgi:hypothetical protein